MWVKPPMTGNGWNTTFLWWPGDGKHDTVLPIHIFSSTRGVQYSCCSPSDGCSNSLAGCCNWLAIAHESWKNLGELRVLHLSIARFFLYLDITMFWHGATSECFSHFFCGLQHQSHALRKLSYDWDHLWDGMKITRAATGHCSRWGPVPDASPASASGAIGSSATSHRSELHHRPPKRSVALELWCLNC